MSKTPGNDIIKEILNGNEKVIAEIYTNVLRHLENYGKLINASDLNIKESVQDAFESFYRQILDKKPKLTCSAETYILSIAKNLLHRNEKEMGFHNKVPISNVDLIDNNNDDNSIEEKKHQLFVTEFNKLTSECKRLITLTLEGYSATQISKKMNYASDKFVWNKRKRCKQYLTDKIKENPDYEKLTNANQDDYGLPVWRDDQAGKGAV